MVKVSVTDPETADSLVISGTYSYVPFNPMVRDPYVPATAEFVSDPPDTNLNVKTDDRSSWSTQETWPVMIPMMSPDVDESDTLSVAFWAVGASFTVVTVIANVPVTAVDPFSPPCGKLKAKLSDVVSLSSCRYCKSPLSISAWVKVSDTASSSPASRVLFPLPSTYNVPLVGPVVTV